MHTQLIHGRRKKESRNIQISDISGHESDDSNLLSESYEEFEMNNGNVIAPCDENEDENIAEKFEENKIQDENIDDNTRNLQNTGLVRFGKSLRIVPVPNIYH